MEDAPAPEDEVLRPGPDDVMDPLVYAARKTKGYFPASMRQHQGSNGKRVPFGVDLEQDAINRAKGHAVQAERREALAKLKLKEELAREEGYQKALTELMPDMLAIDGKLVAMLTQLVEDPEVDIRDGDTRNSIKMLTAEASKMKDRIYGTAKQRKEEDRRQLNVTVDLYDLMKGDE